MGLDYANCNHWFWFYKYFRIRKAMVSGMEKKKSGLLVQVIILISKELLGFMKEATKEPAFFWVIN